MQTDGFLQKLAAAKAKVEESQAASEDFKMPEGLSRSEQKKLLMNLKRARKKAASKHKKAKHAERRGAYKVRKAERDAAEGDGSGASRNSAPRICNAKHGMTV